MNQNKVKILVACHKPDKVFCNDVYIPIHVGRAISKCKEEMKDMIGDDTGDNISEKNPFYSELTAQYWAWKNLKSEYVGLCHYRRYFDKEVTVENVDELLGKKYDMILAPQIEERTNIGERLIRATCLEDTYIFVQCLKKIHNGYYNTAMKVLSGNAVSPYNMFVTKKDVFNEFAQWQFDVLFEMAKYVKLSGYSRMRRVFGYMSEMMLTTFVLHHHLNVNYYPIVSMLRENNNIILGKKSRGFIRSMIVNHILVHGNFTFKSEAAIVNGLKNDGIIFE